MPRTLRCCLSLLLLLGLIVPAGTAQTAPPPARDLPATAEPPLLSAGPVPPPPPFAGPPPFSVPLLPSAPGIPPVVPSQGLLPEAANNLRRFTRAVHALRELPLNPHSSPLIRQILLIPPLATRLVGLVPFPLPHWYQTSPVENVVRDRSFSAFEYRNFGQFQTRLNGWIRPVSTNVHVDLRFDGRGRRDLGLKGAVSRTGPLTGELVFFGTDRVGRAWTLQIVMHDLLVNDDGYPSGGTLRITGSDPMQRLVTRGVTFPQPILEPPLNPRDRRHRRSRQETYPKH